MPGWGQREPKNAAHRTSWAEPGRNSSRWGDAEMWQKMGWALGAVVVKSRRRRKRRNMEKRWERRRRGRKREKRRKRRGGRGVEAEVRSRFRGAPSVRSCWLEGSLYRYTLVWHPRLRDPKGAVASIANDHCKNILSSRWNSGPQTLAPVPEACSPSYFPARGSQLLGFLGPVAFGDWLCSWVTKQTKE